MNLFDYMADALSADEKWELYKEKAVCLCLFRVGFGSDTVKDVPLQCSPPGLQQQLLYKLIFTQQQPSSPEGLIDGRLEPGTFFTRKDIYDHLSIRPQSSTDNTTSSSLSIMQGVSLQQADQEGIEAKNIQNLLCDNFIKKMLKLQIATQVAIPPLQTPSQSLPLSRAASLQRSISTVSAVVQTQIDNQPYYRLNRVFQANIMELITTNFDLNIKKGKKKKGTSFEILEDNAKKRWSKIIEFMLNLIKEQDMENRNIIELLERSKYVEKRGLITSQSMMPTSSTQNSQYQLTVNGFQFILMDQAQQAQNLLLNYIQTAEAGGISPVNLLQFIFTLSLSEPRQIYKVKRDRGSDFIILQDLAMMGLVEILNPECEKKTVKFYATTLLQQFLVSSTGQSMMSLDNATLLDDEAQLIEEGNQNGGISRDAANSDKFIIVETNFKVYAYTRSKVYLALLKHLMKVEYAFPDLVVASLTRKALQPAFERGITSKQIIDFLESHAHVNARLNKLAMQQNLLGGNIGSSPADGYYDYHQQNKKVPTDPLKQSIAERFGLSTAKGTRAKKYEDGSGSSTSSDYVPPNVKQQIELWEKELNCLIVRPAVLVLIKDSQLAEKFKQDFCARRTIAIWRKGVDQQTVKYVIDSKYEKDAMEFEQSPFK